MKQANRRHEKMQREGKSIIRPGGTLTFTYENFGGDRVDFGIGEFLKHCEFNNPRYESLDNNKLIVLNFKSKEGVTIDVKEIKYIEAMEGSVWVDPQAKVVTKLKAWPRLRSNQGRGGQINNGTQTEIVIENIEVARGVWMLGSSKINTTSDPKLFRGNYFIAINERSNYKKYTVEDEYQLNKPTANDE
jgi:hypothetical protein